MRYGVAMLAVLVLSGCGRAPDPGSSETTEDATPGINVTAAPGVAFRYDYAFRLPAERIARVQEAHAQACERLGVARCRITAMRYSRDTDNRIDAELGFRLSPDLARAFGRDGIRAIEAAEGMVLTANIVGEDRGAEIEQLQATRDAATAERTAAEARSRTAGRNERDDIAIQRDLAAATATEATAGITAARQALAATPVDFKYESGDAIRGFDPVSPFTRAADLAVMSTRFTVAAVLAVLGTGLPPLVVALLGWWAWTRGRRAWQRRSAARAD